MATNKSSVREVIVIGGGIAGLLGRDLSRARGTRHAGDRFRPFDGEVGTGGAKLSWLPGWGCGEDLLKHGAATGEVA